MGNQAWNRLDWVATAALVTVGLIAVLTLPSPVRLWVVAAVLVAQVAFHVARRLHQRTVPVNVR